MTRETGRHGTDNSKYHADFPVFRFSDTAWLVTIANLAWIGQDPAALTCCTPTEAARPDPRAHRPAPAAAPPLREALDRGAR